MSEKFLSILIPHAAIVALPSRRLSGGASGPHEAASKMSKALQVP